MADDPVVTGVPTPELKPPAKSLTIGAVVKALGTEFPDITISKIRYLEDQKLLTPRRTPGGYRLYSTDDVARLRTILRLQRDEFLPLRVIRQELARGRSEADAAPQPAPAEKRPSAGPRRTGISIREPGSWSTLEEVVEATGASRQLIAELHDYGLIGGRTRDGATAGPGANRLYDDTEREIVRACTELARFGVAGRNLRVFKTSSDRESSLLQQLLAPSLRSRNPERRREAVETLENLAAVASHLNGLLLVSDLRRLLQGSGFVKLLRDRIRDIPDYPKPGIVFKDITPLLLDPAAIDAAVGALADWARPRDVELVVAAEARGFILGGALARELGAGFVPARKPGKLPHDTISAEYILEYGVDALEMHADALAHGARVLVHDDLLATGGTARALCELVEGRGAIVVGCAFIVELAFLPGRDQLRGYDVEALVGFA